MFALSSSARLYVAYLLWVKNSRDLLACSANIVFCKWEDGGGFLLLEVLSWLERVPCPAGGVGRVPRAGLGSAAPERHPMPASSQEGKTGREQGFVAGWGCKSDVEWILHRGRRGGCRGAPQSCPRAFPRGSRRNPQPRGFVPAGQPWDRGLCAGWNENRWIVLLFSAGVRS